MGDKEDGTSKRNEVTIPSTGNIFKDGLMEFVYLKSDNNSSEIAFYMIEIIQGFQLLSLSFLSGYAWPRDQESIRGFVQLLKYLRLDAFILDQLLPETYYIAAITIWVICFGFLATLALLTKLLSNYYQSTNRPNSLSRIIIFLNVVYRLFTTILYFPIIGLLLATIRLGFFQTTLFDGPVIPTGYLPSLYGFISIIFLVLFVASLASIILTEPRSGAFKTSQNRIELTHFFGKTLIYTTFHVVDSSLVPSAILGISMFLLWVTLALLFIRFLPFHSFRSNQIRSAALLAQAWAGLSLSVTGLERASLETTSVVLVYFFGLPISVCLGYFIPLARLNVIKRKKMTNLSNPYICELKLRVIKDVFKGNVNNNEQKRKESWEVFHASQIQWLVEYNQKHPSTFAKILLIEQYGHNEDVNFESILREVISMQRQSHWLDSQYFIFSKQKQIAKRINMKWHFDKVLRELTSQDEYEEALRLDLKLMELYEEFWRESLEKYLNSTKMESLSKSIRETGQMCLVRYENVLRNRKNNKQALEQYSDFLQVAMSNPFSAHVYMEQAQIVKSKALGHDSNDLLDDDCVVSITSTKTKFGIITDVNANAATLFGHSKNILIGKSIDTLLPSIIETMHRDIKPDRTYSTSHSDGLTSFILNSSGGIVPVYFFVQEIPKFSDEHSFIIVMRDLRNYHDKYRYAALIDEVTQCFQATTLEFCDYFNHDINNIIGKDVSYVLPEFELQKDQMNEISGLEIAAPRQCHIFLTGVSGKKSGIKSSYYIMYVYPLKGTKVSSKFDGDDQNVSFSIRDEPKLKRNPAKMDGKSNPDPEESSTGIIEDVAIQRMRASVRDVNFMEPIVANFEKYTRLIMTFVILAAIITVIVIPNMLQIFKSHSLLSQVGNRRYLSCAIGYEIQNLALINTRRLNDSDGKLEAEARKNLKKHVDTYEDIIKHLGKVDNGDDKNHNPHILLAISRLGIAGSERLNLRDAENNLITAARVLANTSIFDIYMNSTNNMGYFASQNSPFSIVSSLNASVQSYESSTIDELQTIETTSIVLSTTSAILVVLLNVLIVIPSILSVYKKKRKVTELLRDIPAGDRRSILSAVSQRKEKLQKLNGVECTNTFANDVASEPENTDEALKLKIVKSENRSHYGIFARTSLFTIASLCYFITFHVYAFVIQKERIYEAPIKVNWANYRKIGMVRQHMLVRSILMDEMNLNVSMKQEAINEINLNEAANHDLVFGDDKSVRHLESNYNQKSPDHERLIHKDACFPFSGVDKNHCEQFSGNVLSGGLHAGLLKFYAMERELVNIFSAIENPSNEVILSNLDSQKWKEASSFVFSFLQIPIQYSEDAYTLETVELLDHITYLQIIMFSVLFALSTIYYFRIFPGVKAELNGILKDANNILTIVPSDIRYRLATYHKLIRNEQ